MPLLVNNPGGLYLDDPAVRVVDLLESQEDPVPHSSERSAARGCGPPGRGGGRGLLLRQLCGHCLVLILSDLAGYPGPSVRASPAPPGPRQGAGAPSCRAAGPSVRAAHAPPGPRQGSADPSCRAATTWGGTTHTPAWHGPHRRVAPPPARVTSWPCGWFHPCRGPGWPRP